jgi:hypothetical protein
MMKIAIILLSALLVFGCENHQSALMIGPESKNALEELKSRKKFVQDDSFLYPGAPDETTRIQAENAINNAISELIGASEHAFTKEMFWSISERAARRLSEMDSEEMDRGFVYMEEIMDILGIESSGGRLNKWRYGFDIK